MIYSFKISLGSQSQDWQFPRILLNNKYPSIDGFCLIDKSVLLPNHFNVSSSKLDYTLEAHINASPEKQIAFRELPGLHLRLFRLKQI